LHVKTYNYLAIGGGKPPPLANYKEKIQMNKNIEVVKEEDIL
jgi:hypothetical protein